MAKRLSDEEIIERAVLAALKANKKTGPWIDEVPAVPWGPAEGTMEEVYVQPLAVAWVMLKIGDRPERYFCYSDSLTNIFPTGEATWFDLNTMASTLERGPASSGYTFSYPMKLTSVAEFVVIHRRRYDLE